jgi:hypothetical protein
MTRQLGDRRSRLRLEVVGSLWGALDFEDVARVVNISDTGLLIAARSAPPLDSVQAIRLRRDGHEVTVVARVRHFRQTTGPAGSPEYLVGLELVGSGSTATS